MSKKTSIERIISSVITKIGIAIILVLGGFYLITQLLNLSSNLMSEISKNFSTGKVKNGFHSYITEIKGLNRLQIASINSLEIFSKKDSKSILWDLVVLPDVVVELKVPVEYTYYIDLMGKWEFNWEAKDSSIFIVAPNIENGTPAVDISKMEIYEKKGSIFRDVDQVKENLKNELTTKLNDVAVQKIELIRETARKETEYFVKNWLLNHFFKESDFKPKKVEIFFNDERMFIEQNVLLEIDK